MEEFSIKARDGLELHCTAFHCENPVGIVQIIHGAKEHRKRYYDFCRFLRENGYSVIISDNRGHGESVNDRYFLGYMEDAEELVEDQLEISRYIMARYPGARLYLLGHSFGSCIARMYMREHDDLIEKLVLLGTVNYHKCIGALMPLVGSISRVFGGAERNEFILRYSDNGDDSWLSYSQENLMRYRRDVLCSGYRYTNAAILTIMQSVRELAKCRHFRCKNPGLPILIISGEDDPVTGGAHGLAGITEMLHKIGYANIKNIVYSGMKHEVLNEAGRDRVYDDILRFLNEK